uniref:G-protein coupled receptors family 1 profile domain-containing protein n=1 Tax=Panagrolaimus sp. JU765 TaxID=591449 RepID=A0AC34RAG8_9BILA
MGVLANILIITVLLRQKMRTNPFNLFLIAIALCDISLMVSYFAYYQVEICHPWFFSFAWITFTHIYAIFSVIVHSASLWLTVNMAIMRYLVLRNGSRSNSSSKVNNFTVAIVFITISILISLTGGAANMLRYQVKYDGKVPAPRMCLKSPYKANYHENSTVDGYYLIQPKFWNCQWERVSFWTMGILLKVVPCILLTIFMLLLVRMLVDAKNRRSRLSHGSGISSASAGAVLKPKLHPSSSSAGKSNQAAERTTAMLVLIVLCTMITELPQGILAVVVGLEPAFSGAAQLLGNFTDVLSLINSSVNFILYSTMSHLFRQEFLSAFNECCSWRKVYGYEKNGHRPLHIVSSRNDLAQVGATGLTGLSAQSTNLKNHLLRSPAVSARSSINETQEQQLLIENKNGNVVEDDDDDGVADENV